MRRHINHNHQQHTERMHISDVYLSMEWHGVGECGILSDRVLLWIASCQSRGIHRRIRNRWMPEHTTNYNDYYQFNHDHYDYWHWHNNQHDD
jgi:hypothetical protein